MYYFTIQWLLELYIILCNITQYSDYINKKIDILIG